MVGEIYGDPDNGEDIIFDPRNGLWLESRIEAAFDKGRIVIVPVNPKRRKVGDPEQLRLKLRVIDPSLLKTPRGKKQKFDWKELDGQELDFGGATFRPALRFLFVQHYFALMSFARARERGGDAHRFTTEEVNEVYPSIGTYLDSSILLCLKLQDEGSG